MKEKKDFLSIIIEKFNSLKEIQKLVLCIITVILLIIGSYLLSKIRFGKSLIDYSEFKITDVVSSLEESTDRQIFVNSEQIVSRLIQTYYGEYSINNKKVSMKDLYDHTIFDEYKYKLSKSKFKSFIKNISEDFYEEYNLKNVSEIKNDSIISSVYVYSEAYDMYIVKLNIQKNEHYIGIKYDNENSFEIFYIN